MFLGPFNMSDENTFELTRRRALGGLLTIGVGSAAMGAGTLAAFSDTEESTGNQVTAGTLDLSTPSTGEFSATDLAPGDQTDEFNVSTSYSGSINATVDLDIALTEPTEDQSSLDTESGTDAGVDVTAREFASQLTVDTAIANHADGSTTSDLTSDLGSSVSADQLSDQTFTDTFGDVTDDDSISVDLQFTLDEDAGNKFQGDGVSFDLTFTANQA